MVHCSGKTFTSTSVRWINEGNNARTDSEYPLESKLSH